MTRGLAFVAQRKRVGSTPPDLRASGRYGRIVRTCHGEHEQRNGGLDAPGGRRRFGRPRGPVFPLPRTAPKDDPPQDGSPHARAARRVRRSSGSVLGVLTIDRRLCERPVNSLLLVAAY